MVDMAAAAKAAIITPRSATGKTPGSTKALTKPDSLSFRSG